MNLRRRAFLRAMFPLAGGAALLAAGGGAAAVAQVVSGDNRRLINSPEEFRTRRGRVRGYLSRPMGAGPARPGILVVHGEEGLTPHYRDVARRLALEGFVVLAPDFLSLGQGTPEDPQVARSAIGRLDHRVAIDIAMGAVDFLVARRDTQRRIGIVGFGWGGHLAQSFALESRDVVATVSFYGALLDARRAATLRTPLMLHHVPGDEEQDAALPAVREALDTGAANHSVHEYESVAHGFHNEASEAYDAEAAELAWSRTMAFLRQELG